jgi:hypothetical protein
VAGHSPGDAAGDEHDQEEDGAADETQHAGGHGAEGGAHPGAAALVEVHLSRAVARDEGLALDLAPLQRVLVLELGEHLRRRLRPAEAEHHHVVGGLAARGGW